MCGPPSFSQQPGQHTQTRSAEDRLPDKEQPPEFIGCSAAEMTRPGIVFDGPVRRVSPIMPTGALRTNVYADKFNRHFHTCQDELPFGTT